MAVYLGNRPVLSNGVGGTTLVTGHGASHGAGGSDELTPAAIGAAAAEHTHAQYAPIPTALTVTLTREGWTEYTSFCSQLARITGMRSNKFALIAPAPDSYGAYVECGVYCSMQGYNGLSFTAAKLPPADINVNVMYWG